MLTIRTVEAENVSKISDNERTELSELKDFRITDWQEALYKV